jgi:hypothetical protein
MGCFSEEEYFLKPKLFQGWKKAPQRQNAQTGYGIMPLYTSNSVGMCSSNLDDQSFGVESR